MPRPRKERLSQRALAKLLGVSEAAVRKGIRSGRLRKSGRGDARDWYATDVALARRQWKAGASKPANGGHGGGRKRAQRAARNAAPPPDLPPPSSGPAEPVASAAPENGTLVHAQVRVADQRALALELANKRRSGELVERAVIQREYFAIARMLRERILNVADRLADLGPVVRARVRDELRQALGDLADELERE